MIELKPFSQKAGLCGPTSLKMILDYYGVSASEAKIVKLAGASKKRGTSIEGLVKAAEYFGFHVFVKKESSLQDIRYFIKREIPVIVDWFLEDDGHYSVVIGINKKYITLMDPSLEKSTMYTRKRRIPIKTFLRVWFDFPGELIEPKNLIIRAMLVVTPFKISRK